MFVCLCLAFMGESWRGIRGHLAVQLACTLNIISYVGIVSAGQVDHQAEHKQNQSKAFPDLGKKSGCLGFPEHLMLLLRHLAVR